MCVCMLVYTQPSTGLLCSSPGLQLRVTARCLGSVIWRRVGGSGRSEVGNNDMINTNTSYHMHTKGHSLNKVVNLKTI